MNDNSLDAPKQTSFFSNNKIENYSFTFGNPTYSSILKVTTYLNDNSLALTNSINFLYVPIGVLPRKAKSSIMSFILYNLIQTSW